MLRHETVLFLYTFLVVNIRGSRKAALSLSQDRENKRASHKFWSPVFFHLESLGLIWASWIV